MTYGHLQADCLYTGISSGPNARYRVWEAFTFTFLLCFLDKQIDDDDDDDEVKRGATHVSRGGVSEA